MDGSVAGVDQSEYEAVIERHVREALGLADDDPLPPPGPVAIGTELVREDSRRLCEEVTRRYPAYEEALTAVLHLAQGVSDGTPEIVWRDPAPR